MSHRNKKWKGRAQHALAQTIFERALLGEETSDERKSFNPRQDRKTLQLCRQVQRALILALAGECTDILRSIYVESVEPMGSASQLLVRISLPVGENIPWLQVLAQLNARSPRLRTIVAQSICRKRAPNLSFIAAAGGEQSLEGDQQ